MGRLFWSPIQQKNAHVSFPVGMVIFSGQSVMDFMRMVSWAAAKKGVKGGVAL